MTVKRNYQSVSSDKHSDFCVYIVYTNSMGEIYLLWGHRFKTILQTTDMESFVDSSTSRPIEKL